MLARDIVAGITVGLVALPLAMAFAIASGLSPQAGIYCAIVTGFIISALGGSKFQIGGPTGAFVVVVAGIIADYGVSGLFMCTMMAGVILVVLGATGMGSAVKYLPRPVVVGFTNGIAVLIASTQIKDFLGLRIGAVPAAFLAADRSARGRSATRSTLARRPLASARWWASWCCGVCCPAFPEPSWHSRPAQSWWCSRTWELRPSARGSAAFRRVSPGRCCPDSSRR